MKEYYTCVEGAVRVCEKEINMVWEIKQGIPQRKWKQWDEE